MTPQFIADNFRLFNRNSLAPWNNPLGDVLLALFDHILNLDYDMQILDMVDQSRMSLYTLFDLPHGPSSACEMHVLTVDDVLIGLVSRSGKTNEYQTQVLNPEGYANYAAELAAAAARAKAAKMAPIAWEAPCPFESYCMHFLDEPPTMFALRGPRSLYRINEMPEKHRTFFVDESGAAHAVSSIGAFVNPGSPFSEDYEIFIVVEGQERKADASQLMFELIKGQGNVSAALREYPAEACWWVDKLAPTVNRALLSVTAPFRRGAETIWVEFASEEALQNFADANFKDGQKAVMPGKFTADILGPDGSIFRPIL